MSSANFNVDFVGKLSFVDHVVNDVVVFPSLINKGGGKNLGFETTNEYCPVLLSMGFTE